MTAPPPAPATAPAPAPAPAPAAATRPTPSKRLLLLGGGHAHVHVLKALARQPLPGVRVTLVTPFEQQVYSGMVPGLVAGHYQPAQCVIPLRPLLAAAGVEPIFAAGVSIDAARRTVVLGGGGGSGGPGPVHELPYDLLSVDTGSVMDRDVIAGAREHALFVRPIEHFMDHLGGVMALGAQRALDIVVAGGGAAGFELSTAFAWRLGRLHGGAGGAARVAWVTGGQPPLASYPAGVQRRARAALKALRVTVFEGTVSRIGANAVELDSGARLACDCPVIAVGASPPRWLAGSGLALDERGFLATGPTLQSTSHPEVFAAGDVATRVDAPHPKSGVYAVRAGPHLADNLRRAALGQPLQPWHPQRRTLNLLACGSQTAIVAWGGLAAGGVSWAGRLAWAWKDRIDSGFIGRMSGA